MELRLYFQFLRRGWWIILLTILVAVIGALSYSYLAVPQYQAIARFIVSPSAELITRSDVLYSLNTLDNQSVMFTYSQVMSSERILTDTLASLKLQPKDIEAYTYTVTVISNSSVMEVSVIGPNAQLAADLANALGNETIRFVGRMNTVFTLSFLDTAVPPILVYSPQPLLYTGLALMLGLILGIFLTVIAEQISLSLEVLRQRFNFDSITGTYTKKFFARCLEDELAQKPDNVLSVGIVELIGINDLVETLPLTSLQKVFKNVTDTLHQELRGNDIIGRWDDISFIIMLPNTTGIAANRIFGRIFHALSQPFELGQFDLVLNLDAHIGGAEYGNHITAQELFERANIALEQARQKNDIPVYVSDKKDSI